MRETKNIKARKLFLHRETLSRLDLDRVGGGKPFTENPGDGAFSIQPGCRLTDAISLAIDHPKCW